MLQHALRRTTTNRYVDSEKKRASDELDKINSEIKADKEKDKVAERPDYLKDAFKGINKVNQANYYNVFWFDTNISNNEN